MYGGSLLVKGGTIVTAYGKFKADIKIVDGVIVDIGKDLTSSGVEEVIDVSGFLVLPGIVDEHVHMREPGLEYKDNFTNGTMGAALGGVTTVIEMPNTKPPVENGRILREKADLLKTKAYVDFALYGVIHNANSHEFEDIVAAGAVGFKVFLGPTTGNIPPPDDGTLYEILTKSHKQDIPIAFHAENADLVRYFTKKIKETGRTDPAAHTDARPPICEEDSIRKLAVFSKRTGGKVLVVHIATKEGVEIIKEAKYMGLNMFGETCPHYLLLNRDDYEKYGTAIKVNPPIREREHQEALWRGVMEGVITNLGSDHAPHSEEEKRGNVWECAAGFTGVQTFLSLMLDQALKGRLPLTKLVELMSLNPAKLFRLWPRKGDIMVGSDGDLVVVDPEGETVISKEWIKAKYPITPYIGWRLKGSLKYTVLRGNVIVKDGEILRGPLGIFIKRAE